MMGIGKTSACADLRVNFDCSCNLTSALVQVCAAMCNILATVLARAPKAALRSKFAASSQILTIVAEQHLDEVRPHMTKSWRVPHQSSRLVRASADLKGLDSVMQPQNTECLSTP